MLEKKQNKTTNKNQMAPTAPMLMQVLPNPVSIQA